MDSDADILALSDNDLTAMASAIRSGRLTCPPSQISLAQIIGASHAARATPALAAWAERGFTADQVAWTLELLLQSRRTLPKVEDHVDLVVTGPQNVGVVTRHTAAVVHELFSRAEQSVTVVGYAVHKGQRVFKALAERMAKVPTLRVRMLFDIQRGNNLSAADELIAGFVHRLKTVEWPSAHPLPEVYYYPPSLALGGDSRSCLHAKCVIIDDQAAFVSSANFTEAAQERNIEVGVIIRSPTVAGYLARHFASLVDDRVLQRIL